MTNTITHASTTTEGEGVPEFLKREAKSDTTVTVTAQRTEPSKPKVDVRARIKAAAEKRAAEGKVAKAKPAKVAKPAEGDEPKLPRSVVPARFKQEYAAHGNHCGDRMGEALKAATTTTNADGREALDHKALAGIAEANGIDMKPYVGLNPGMQRMNVGNKLRGMLKHGKPVQIGKQRFADASKALAKQPVEAKPAPVEQVAA